MKFGIIIDGNNKLMDSLAFRTLLNFISNNHPGNITDIYLIFNNEISISSYRRYIVAFLFFLKDVDATLYLACKSSDQIRFNDYQYNYMKDKLKFMELSDLDTLDIVVYQSGNIEINGNVVGIVENNKINIDNEHLKTVKDLLY